MLNIVIGLICFMFTLYNKLPDGFFDIAPEDLHTILPGPSMIELEGEKNPPLFISTLLHGNETSGFYGLQTLLKKYEASNIKLPRSLIIFIGNVFAAKESKRTLDSQLDFNRIWDGGQLPEYKMADEVKQFAIKKNVIAAIDIHNNTGENPYYACVNTLQDSFLNLAKLFSRKIVYFTNPHEVLTMAFKEFTTAVTLECGQSGNQLGLQRLVDFLDMVLRLESIPNTKVTDDDVAVFHSVTRITVPDDASIAFTQNDHADFTFVPNFEHLNFQELPEHSLLGWRKYHSQKLIVTDEQEQDVSDQFITYADKEIRTKRPVMPSMFCTTEKIIRQDCLGYFMQRYSL